MTALLAAGRTADVFAGGPGRVRRVYRDGRDATGEARLMRHLAAHGYPVPQVFDARGPAIVMAAVDGPTLAGLAVADPDRLAAAAATLRDLHDRLAAIPPPPRLYSPFGTGDSVLHLDLHPYNVVVGADGPVVIDWATAARGPGVVDRVHTWVVLSTAVSPDPAIDPAVFERARTAFGGALLGGDDDPGRAWVAAAARRRLLDPNVLLAEVEPLRRLARTAMA